MSHWIRHQIWKQQNPGKKARKMVNPEAWLGKVIPADFDPVTVPVDLGDYTECDYTGKFIRWSDCHSFIYPATDAEWNLLKALHIDYAYGFCDEAIAELEKRAYQINPNWYEEYQAHLDAT